MTIPQGVSMGPSYGLSINQSKIQSKPSQQPRVGGPSIFGNRKDSNISQSTPNGSAETKGTLTEQLSVLFGLKSPTVQAKPAQQPRISDDSMELQINQPPIQSKPSKQPRISDDSMELQINQPPIQSKPSKQPRISDESTGFQFSKVMQND